MNNKEKRESIANKQLKEKFGTSEYKTVIVEAQEDRQINLTTCIITELGEIKPSAITITDLKKTEDIREKLNKAVLTMNLDD